MATVISQETIEQRRWADEARRNAREAAEKQRKEDVTRLRAEAQSLGQQLMDIRQRKFADEHAHRNPDFVADPEIDVLEIRYQRAVRELEEKDQDE